MEVIQTRKIIEKNNKKIIFFQNEIEMYKQQRGETNAHVDCEVKELSRKIEVLTTENEELRNKMDITILVKMLKNGEVLVEKLTPKEWDKIFNLVNCLYNDSLIKLKSEYNQLTKHDIKLLTFLFLGFTTKELMILFDSKDEHTIFKAKPQLKGAFRISKRRFNRNFFAKCRNHKSK